MKKIKTLILSDDYNSLLCEEGYYQSIVNYHPDEPYFDLTIRETCDLSDLDNFDIVIFDYGLLGNLSLLQMKRLYKIKNLFVTSALGEYYLKGENCNLPYVDFRIELMYIDLIQHLKGGQ